MDNMLWQSLCGRYRVTESRIGGIEVWERGNPQSDGGIFYNRIWLGNLPDGTNAKLFANHLMSSRLYKIIDDACNGVSMEKDNETNEALFSSIKDEVYEEIRQAIEEYPSMNSYAEGLEILREEFDEVTEEIRKKRPDRSRVMGEMTQVAAMAIRFMHDLDNADERGYRKDKNKGG